jgi:ATP-dependent Clp protease ATP-binding subunit ClpA
MFERFTKAAREAVVRAQQEARDLRQSPIGTEHLLLALLAGEDTGAAAALRERGVDGRHVRAAILRLVGPGSHDPGPEGTGDPRADRDAEDAAALKAIGIDLDAVRRAIEENFGPGALRLPDDAPKRRRLFGRFAGAPGHIPFSPRAKKTLELSLREAIRLKHNFIAPEHILLGIIREGQGLACRILADAGVDTAALRTDLARALDEHAA